MKRLDHERCKARLGAVQEKKCEKRMDERRILADWTKEFMKREERRKEINCKEGRIKKMEQRKYVCEG